MRFKLVSKIIYRSQDDLGDDWSLITGGTLDNVATDLFKEFDISFSTLPLGDARHNVVHLPHAFQAHNALATEVMLKEVEVIFEQVDNTDAGAAGYLMKGARVSELIDAIRAVYAGESVLHPIIARRVIDRMKSLAPKFSELQEAEALSGRELEVLKLTAKGISNKEIAEQLFLSQRTVQAHLGDIFNKLGVASRTEAVLYGLRRGWFTMKDLP